MVISCGIFCKTGMSDEVNFLVRTLLMIKYLVA